MFERQLEERKQRIENARGPFKALCSGWMSVDNGGVFDGRRLPVFTRLEKALFALREWRNANQQRHEWREEVALAVRVVTDSMASEIAAAAGEQQDAATVAWVVAGLRCPARPFCRGCDACFTIDAPHRADVDFAKKGR